mmetsp:Transcript_110463/g.330441  ORF Transcript_110463/g.330441 Transcript_110463/m.330441 type:complete len:153 (+) Transcript_110463:75-533(+)
MAAVRRGAAAACARRRSWLALFCIAGLAAASLRLPRSAAYLAGGQHLCRGPSRLHISGRRTLSVACAAEAGDAGAKGSGKEEVQYADDVMPEVTGAVRLYATHTLCISCLACCCQFKRLLPNVKLEVAFDVWRETRRWVGTPEDLQLPREDV